jgi:hypothetical protein
VKLLKDAAADEPVARLAEVLGGSIVAVLPDAVFVEDLDEDIRADGEGEARVEEVAGVDDDGSAAAFGAEGAEGVEEVVDVAVAFEEVHVFDPAEVAIERGREDDDGDVGAAAAEESGDFGAELAGAEVVVEDGDVDAVEEFSGFFDGGGGDALVAVLAQDRGAEMKVGGLVVQEQDADGMGVDVWHLVEGRYAVGRLNHGLLPSMMLLYTTLVTT